MTVLVTGASGFIGRHVCRELESMQLEFVALCRPGRASAARQAVGTHVATITDCDDISALARSFESRHVESVIHLAARFDDSSDPNTARTIVETNVGFATRVAEAAALAAPGAAFVNAGTIWQHVDDDGYQPASLYAATKQAFEDILVHYKTQGRLVPRTIILPDTYGPGDQRAKIVPLLLTALRTQDPLDASSGGGVLDLLHAHDIARGFAHALVGDLGAGRWQLTSGRAVSVRELHSLLSRLAGTDIPVVWGAIPDRSNTIRGLITGAPRLPDWEPVIELECGLRELIESQRAVSTSPTEHCS